MGLMFRRLQILVNEKCADSGRITSGWLTFAMFLAADNAIRFASVPPDTIKPVAFLPWSNAASSSMTSRSSCAVPGKIPLSPKFDSENIWYAFTARGWGLVHIEHKILPSAYRLSRARAFFSSAKTDFLLDTLGRKLSPLHISL